MRYVLALFLPPLAVLSCGKLTQTFLNVILTLCLWVPGVIHALFVVVDYHAERRSREVIDALKRFGRYP